MEELKTLESLGFAMPVPAYLFGLFIFGIIGFAAYRYGKKVSLQTFKWIGVALMFYPYFVSATWMLYGVGLLLCVGLYFNRK
jgi:hypothetical protein